jgi:hypothetical protein
MVYIPVGESAEGTAKVVYTSKDGRNRKTFDDLDWLAHLVTHVPGRYEQTARYCGYYSNKSRGLRKKSHAEGGDDDEQVIRKILNHLGLWETRRYGIGDFGRRPEAPMIIP